LKFRGLAVAREWWHHGVHENHESILADVLALVLGFILLCGWAIRGGGGLWISN
jgi:hypothetical protein